VAVASLLNLQRSSSEEDNPAAVVGWTVTGAFIGSAVAGELPRKLVKSKVRVKSIFMMSPSLD